MNRHRHRVWHLAGLARLALWLFVALLIPLQAALAVEPADTATGFPMIDLEPYMAGLETDLRAVPIQRPDAGTGLTDFMTLQSKGPGPRFRWAAAGFRNGSNAARDVVITVPERGFVGSGFFPLKRAGSRVVSNVAAGPIRLDILPVVGQGAYAFTLPPGRTAAIAFETTELPLKGVSLWQRSDFDARKDYLAFFRGALLGVAVLLTVAIFALYGFRSRTVFLAAGGFAMASTGFMVLEAGHLPSILAVLDIPALDLQAARAIIEGAMAGFLILLLVLISELHRLARMAGNLLLMAGGLAFAVPVYGLAEPALATAIARALFAVTALGGFLLIFVLWRKGAAKAETALVSWSAILLWAFLAMIAAAQDAPASLSPLLLAGLCAVLVILAFTLAHHAFSQGYLSRHFFREAGRHALAMAGARTYVWDWQPEEGELFISEEIERALAQPHGLIAEAGSEAFLELMHPSDRTAYLAAIEDAGADGRTPIEKEFRLRHGDGTYRWFQLRARAIAGHGQRAVRCIGTLADVTFAKIAEERLLSDAVYDVVTGLPNRALFADRLTRLLGSDEGETAAGIYVLLIGIDRFKLVNDAMGHEAGDALLSVMGRRLVAEAGPGDSVARLPGDQFAIHFTEMEGGRDVGEFAEDLLKAVSRPTVLDGQEYFLTACIGIAHVRDPDVTAGQLMKDAALALYEAKRRGTEAIELFNPAMRDDRAELVVLESELRRAIERNEIEVHYQPIARLSDMHLAGFEALVRWQHPNLGLLSPESFVGLAEETGMIKDLGRAVLNEAGRQLGIWQRAYRPAEPVFVAVNISSAQLIETDLLDDVKQVLHRENLMRGSLKIEVTESLVMQYPERASQILERLRDIGVGISCDDFGTGYSSLSSLRKLPFDTLKVDRSFIAADARDSRATVILDAIIAMAHALGLGIVAEGIEDQDQVDRLGALGCDYGQGFFIGRPLTAKQVNDALSGLPYASTSGRTAITWLWERALKDPPPTPKRRRVTAEGIEEQRAVNTRAAPGKPAPAAVIFPRPKPKPELPVEAIQEEPAAEDMDDAAAFETMDTEAETGTPPEIIIEDAETEPELAEPAEVQPDRQRPRRRRKKKRS